MKAIAKRKCEVAQGTKESFDYLDQENCENLNYRIIKKGTIIELPVFDDKTFKDERVIEVLGNRAVIFQNGLTLISTYAKDFDYID